MAAALEITFPRRKGRQLQEPAEGNGQGAQEGQNPLCIRFSLDGTAGGICWEAVT